jgi:hypothetical protein
VPNLPPRWRRRAHLVLFWLARLLAPLSLVSGGVLHDWLSMGVAGLLITFWGIGLAARIISGQTLPSVSLGGRALMTIAVCLFIIRWASGDFLALPLSRFLVNAAMASDMLAHLLHDDDNNDGDEREPEADYAPSQPVLVGVVS